MTAYSEDLIALIDGGSAFSELRYAIKRDGRDTGVVETIRTDGSPHYRVTKVEYFDVATGEGLDAKNTPDKEIIAWLNTHC